MFRPPQSLVQMRSVVTNNYAGAQQREFCFAFLIRVNGRSPKDAAHLRLEPGAESPRVECR